MRNLFLVSFVVATLFSTAHAEAPISQTPPPFSPQLESRPVAPEKVKWSESDTLALVSRISGEYGISEGLMTKVLDCESGLASTTIQSRYRNPDGSLERSFGLAQINLDWNPDVTYEQATDPEFAVRFLARNLSEGRGSKWTCWRTLRASGKV